MEKYYQVCRLCDGLVTQQDVTIKLRGNDKEFKVLAFSYIDSRNVNMTLKYGATNLIITRPRNEVYCVGCQHQK